MKSVNDPGRRIFARRMARPLSDSEIACVAGGFYKASPGVGLDWDAPPSNPYADGYLPY